MIETERLILREYIPDDFDALYEIVSDPEGDRSVRRIKRASTLIMLLGDLIWILKLQLPLIT